MAPAGRLAQAAHRHEPQPAAITKEANKKSRHKPIRQLVKEVGSFATEIKPCFMMSPLTVSMFLSGDARFDAVIFDEASQVLPADAINCIYRGRQLIVAGDQKQLPPPTSSPVPTTQSPATRISTRSNRSSTSVSLPADFGHFR